MSKFGPPRPVDDPVLELTPEYVEHMGVRSAVSIEVRLMRDWLRMYPTTRRSRAGSEGGPGVGNEESSEVSVMQKPKPYFDHEFFVGVARDLRNAQDPAAVEVQSFARRYLTVMHRRRRLRAAARAERRELLRASPLRQIRFRPPLSVWGEPHDIVVRAEGLAIGAPLMDGRPIHRPVQVLFDRGTGTPYDEVVTALFAKFGREFGANEIMQAYRQWMTPALALARESIDPAIRKVPGLLRRSRMERDALEARLCKWVNTYDTRIFSVCVNRDSLAEAVTSALERAKPGVVVSFCGTMGRPCRIDGQEVQTAWGFGAGNAVVATAHLMELLDPGPYVSLDFYLRGEWEGWGDEYLVAARGAIDESARRPKAFPYYADAGT